jgi:hypothetical protein
MASLHAQVYWIELEHGYSVGVGTTRGGARGFFVLGRRISRSDDHPRPTIAAGQYVGGRVKLTYGLLSESMRRKIERRLREWSDN